MRPPSPEGRSRRTPLWLAGGVAAAVVVVVLLVVFAPWKLLVNDVVDEAAPLAVPGAAASSPPASAAPQNGYASTPAAAVAKPRATAAAAPGVSSRGAFVSNEHATSGSVTVLRLADGSRVLRIEGLDTSNGPDLHVWLSDQKVVEGLSGAFAFDDGAYLDLGSLKGNKGSQNYPIPATADLAKLTSVSIWCSRFAVSFGAAALTTA